MVSRVECLVLVVVMQNMLSGFRTLNPGFQVAANFTDTAVVFNICFETVARFAGQIHKVVS